MPDYSKVAVPYGQLGDMLSVSFFDQAAGRSFHNVVEHQKRIKAMNTKLIEEWAILHGDSSNNAMEFDGLGVQLDWTEDASAYKGNFAFHKACAQACEDVAYLGGSPQVLVMSYPAKTALSLNILQLWYALRQNSGQTPFEDMTPGISVDAWNFGWGPVDFIAERYMHPDAYDLDTAYLLDDKTIDGRNDGAVIRMVDLLPVSGYDLALIKTAHRYLVMEITALMVSIPAYQRKITNIDLSALETPS